MTAFNLPPVGELDVEDLLTLPEGYRYELHEGNLVIVTPATFWHKIMTQRLVDLLRAVGQNAIQDPGVLGDRPRDCRLPDVGVVTELPPAKRSYSNLPGSAYSLVAEVVSPNSLNGEYTDKMDWYAQRGIPQYWIADQTPAGGSDDDALILIHRLESFGGKAVYGLERSLLLSELEAEYRTEAGQ